MVFHCCRADQTWLAKLNLSPVCITLISFTIFIVLEWTTSHIPTIISSLRPRSHSLQKSSRLWEAGQVPHWLTYWVRREFKVGHITPHIHAQTHTCPRADANAHGTKSWSWRCQCHNNLIQRSHNGFLMEKVYNMISALFSFVWVISVPAWMNLNRHHN